MTVIQWNNSEGLATEQVITGALLLYNDKTTILARGDPHQMLTNANKCKRKDGSGLKRTVFRDTVFYFMVKITSVNLNISGHI